MEVASVVLSSGIGPLPHTFFLSVRFPIGLLFVYFFRWFECVSSSVQQAMPSAGGAGKRKEADEKIRYIAYCNSQTGIPIMGVLRLAGIAQGDVGCPKGLRSR